MKAGVFKSSVKMPKKKSPAQEPEQNLSVSNRKETRSDF